MKELYEWMSKHEDAILHIDWFGVEDMLSIKMRIKEKYLVKTFIRFSVEIEIEMTLEDILDHMYYELKGEINEVI